MKKLFIISVIANLLLFGCNPNASQNQMELSEVPVTFIPLRGPITDKKAEISGLAWVGDTLILLPQYPDKFGPDDGVLFTISKSTLLDYINGSSQQPITPDTIKFFAPKLKNSIKKYEGFEAIDVWENTIYLTIESGKDSEMIGYLVSGTISQDLSEIHINTSHLVGIMPPIQMDNRTDEALVITNNRVLTFFEVNGTNLNSQPIAHVFRLDLTLENTIIFPQLEYRVTDATLGPDGSIWVINNASPKDTELYSNLRFAKSDSRDNQPVEQLIKLNYTENGITLADMPPLRIQLGTEARNWEGLVMLNDLGFLLATDKSPGTLLGFVPLP